LVFKASLVEISGILRRIGRLRETSHFLLFPLTAEMAAGAASKCSFSNGDPRPNLPSPKEKSHLSVTLFSFGGDKRDRTADLLNAIAPEVLDSVEVA